MIAFENITLQVHRQILLQETSLQVAAGDKVVLRGESGSGKSSLLKCVVGAIPLSAGRIRMDGLALGADTVAAIRSRVAFIGQEPVLGAETVREAMLLPFGFKAHRGNRPDEERITEVLARLRLPPEILGKPCSRISGGEKQRIAIARALLLGKTIFLADEVTSALDPDSRTSVIHELFRPEITLLSVSHDPEWIGAGSRIITLRNQLLQEDVP